MSFPGSLATIDTMQVSNTTIQTTDATSTVLWNGMAFPAAMTKRYRAVVIGMKADGSDRATYTREFSVYRGASGDIAQGGATATPAPDYASDGTWGGPTVAMDTTNERPQIAVVGKAATTINWRCRIVEL